MSALFIVLLILALCGGGLGYYGGPTYAGYGYGGGGSIIFVLIILWLFGVFK
jgi:hypothetical protein